MSSERASHAVIPRSHGYRETLLSVVLNVLLAGLLLVAACLYAPVIHEAAVSLGIVRWQEFARVFRRVLMVIGGVWILLRFRPWRDGAFSSYARGGAQQIRSQFLTGFCFGFVITLIPIAWQLTHGALTWEHLNGAKIASRLAKSLMSATAASLLEEWFFRGWMERKLRRRVSPWFSVFMVATISAAIHAFRPNILGNRIVEPTFGSAIHIFGEWLSLLLDPARFGPTFAGLFLFAVLLSVVNMSTGTISRSTGLHFAAILLSYSYHAFTDRVFSTPWTGGAILTEAPVTWLILIVAIVLIGRREKAVPAAENAYPAHARG